MALLLSLLLFQDAETERLIESLGDADPAVRDEATRRLGALGESALEPLLKARENPDPEIRARAGDLADKAQERRRNLRLITLDVTDESIEKVLERVREQLPTPAAPPPPTGSWDLESIYWRLKDESHLRFFPEGARRRKVTLKVRQAPVGQVLDALGVAGPVPPVVTYTAGGRFAFRLEATSNGHVLETRKRVDFDGDFEWRVAKLEADRPLLTETCSIHSPQKVFVRGDPRGARATLQGVRWWQGPTRRVVFQQPKDGDAERVGDYEIIIRWPNLVVRSKRPIPAEALRGSFRKFSMSWNPAGFTSILHEAGKGAAEGPPAWCGCVRPRPLNQESVQEVTVSLYSEQNKLADLRTLSVEFAPPVKEAFEVTSPPLK